MIILSMVAGTLLARQMWLSVEKALPLGQEMHLLLFRTKSGRLSLHAMQVFVLEL